MRDYALTAFIFALLPVCLFRPWIGIVVWYWFGIMNPHRLTWDFAYSMPFAMWIGGATLLGVLIAKDRKPIPWNGLLVLICLLMAYYTFTTVVAWAPEFAWPQWRKVAKIILMTLVATLVIHGRQRIYALLMTVGLSIGFYGVKGAIFAVRTAGAGMVQGPEGSFIEGNTFLGLALNMVIPLLIYLGRVEERKWLRRALYVTAGMSAVAVVFTYSRGAYLGLAAIVPFLFLRAKHRIPALAFLAIAAGVASMVLPERVFQRAEKIETYQEDSSANQRLQSWTVAWNLALDRPFTGAGFEFEYAPDNQRWLSYGSEKYSWAITHSSAAHSIYFQVLGQHGFVAFFLWLMLLFGALVSLQNLRRRAGIRQETQWIQGYATGLQIGLIGYMVSGAFLSSAYFDLAYLYFALVAVLWRELRVVERQAEPARVASGQSVLAPNAAATSARY